MFLISTGLVSMSFRSHNPHMSTLTARVLSVQSWRLMLGSAGFPALIVMAQVCFWPVSFSFSRT
jgi:hypothetical protein